MDKVRRARFTQQAFAYLSGFEHIGIGTSLEEREELAGIAVDRNISMREALEVFLDRRMKS